MNRQNQFGRGHWIPKRLVEAWVGGMVTTLSPGATLWASTYRMTDGIGMSPEPGSVLFQCSPAENRVKGISTKVSRSMLGTYLEDPNLALWSRQTWFVLVGASDEGSSTGGQEPSLWAMSPSELSDVVAMQGRGTISSETLAQLSEAGAAFSLDALLHLNRAQRWPGAGGSAPSAANGGRDPVGGGYHFGFNRPTPLGVALDGRIPVASAP